MNWSPRNAMALAIFEAQRGAGFVSPNPLVGCVILDRDGQLLSKGHHAQVGGPHAEEAALNQIEDPNRLDGAHVFVTLEPCAHEGRTPSCAKALAKLPIASVTYGLVDPNPLVAGKGAEILRVAGKQVEEFDELKPELEELAEIFLTNMRARRPFFAAKVAMSLDGKVALSDGRSRWITGEKSRERVHELRGAYDAVMTGVGSVLKDDPRLNARLEKFKSKRQPVVVLDPEGKSFARLPSLNLVSVRAADDVWLVTGPNAPKAPLGQQIRLEMSEQGFDLETLSQQLWQRDVKSVLVESGPITMARFLKAEVLDRLYVFVAPKILGVGQDWTPDLWTKDLNHARRLKALRIDTCGEDVLLTGRFQA